MQNTKVNQKIEQHLCDITPHRRTILPIDEKYNITNNETDTTIEKLKTKKWGL